MTESNYVDAPAGQGRRSKTGCWIAAVAAFVVIVCCCGGFGLLGFGVFKNQQEGVRAADRVLRSPAFMKWDVDSLLSQTAPEYRGESSEAEIRAKTKEAFARIRKKVGLAVEFGTTDGDANNSFQTYVGSGGPHGGVESSVHTSTPTRFEKGRATIELWMLKEDGQWKVGRFFVSGDF